MNNPPAFPVTHKTCADATRLNCEHFGSDGMTLRDYFAAHVMQGLIANDLAVRGIEKIWPDELGWRLAIASYTVADAMLERREQLKQQRYA